ncbi:hypothetical protein BofuT4_uP042440.1 [Botrytis cinerea T4]|uniref:Uncharacterized protein n=1 Tax=Botryotinia fuckeliana (strain T4) TaxID=999810 RepID=G2Y1U3_BOTF4|nr:hypothetical protein BofuT4_uP042440.1 [Botrytis cinerea T4]
MPTPSSDDRQTVWANQATPANESEWNGQADLRLLRVDALNPNRRPVCYFSVGLQCVAAEISNIKSVGFNMSQSAIQ